MVTSEKKTKEDTIKVDIKNFKDGYNKLVDRADYLIVYTTKLQDKVKEHMDKHLTLLDKLEEVATSDGDVKEVFYEYILNKSLGESCNEVFRNVLNRLIESVNTIMAFGLVGEDYLEKVEDINYQINEAGFLYTMKEGELVFSEDDTDKIIMEKIKSNFTDDLINFQVGYIRQKRALEKQKEAEGEQDNKEEKN